MTPEPITREDVYYDFLINGGDAEKLPKPITRKEIYLNYLCQNGFGVGGGTGEGGTPVGEIISYMGVTAPPNYLICDGAEYQIADYPYLAQHFLDNFGSVNFFGGDGTTTFAVPDLRGEFLRGTGTAERDTGSGADVGVHQNGTNSPYIQRIVRSSGAVGGIIFDGIRDNSGIGAYETDKQSKVAGNIYQVNSDLNGYQATWTNEAIVSYTSRPTNTSVLYCIKYKPTYFAKIEAESEENA